MIGYVTNGGWLDGNAASGHPRHAGAASSTKSTWYNLRGQRSAPAANSRRREGGHRSSRAGSRATVAIMLLVKQPGAGPFAGGGTISYHDIGEYLSREEKLAAVAGASIDVTCPGNGSRRTSSTTGLTNAMTGTAISSRWLANPARSSISHSMGP